MNENYGDNKMTTEQTLERETGVPTVHLDFAYKNIYGQVFSEHKIDSWNLPEPTNFAADIFDGYIKTDFGDFAIEKPLKAAINAIADIREFCRLSKEISAVEKALINAEQQHRVSVSRYQIHNDEESWASTNREVEDTRQKVSALRYTLHNIVEPKIKEYAL